MKKNLRRVEAVPIYCGARLPALSVTKAFSRPHFHSNDRFITVLKGTWWVGTGKVRSCQHGTYDGGHLRHPFWQAGPLGRRQG
jgi:hypothetical protein